MWRRLGVVLTAFVAAFTITGAGITRHVSPESENRAAARLVSALTGVHGSSGRLAASIPDAIPGDFADVMGYQPVLITDESGITRWVKPTGTCSSPFEVWKLFEAACQTHDLGYDVLRYAAATSGQLGPWARRAIDDRFADDMRVRCARSGNTNCDVLAATADAVVRVNSWRQGYSVPASEDGTPYAIALSVIAMAFIVPVRREQWGVLGLSRNGMRPSRETTQDAAVVITR